MNMLHIALQDGFRNDSVIIKVDGRTVFEKSGVTTNLTISYAEAVDVVVSNVTAAVEVSVPSRTQAAQRTVNVLETQYLAVNLSENGVPQLVPSKEMFHYM
jgi:hypothetical protein